jgi:hypothetical protein
LVDYTILYAINQVITWYTANRKVLYFRLYYKQHSFEESICRPLIGKQIHKPCFYYCRSIPIWRTGIWKVLRIISGIFTICKARIISIIEYGHIPAFLFKFWIRTNFFIKLNALYCWKLVIAERIFIIRTNGIKWWSL